MYRLPSQFDARPKQLPESAAGGGSTSTTCSSCVVTLLAVNSLAARQLASLARQASSDTATSTDTSTVNNSPAQGPSSTAWGTLGFFLLPIAIFIGFAVGGGLSVFSPLFAIATFIGGFCLAYDKLTNNPQRGAKVALLFVVGTVVGTIVEVFLWLGSGIL